MLSAKAMSQAIRMKRKKVSDDGVENMVDTAPLPQMNPQDIYNLKQKAQMQDTMGTPPEMVGLSDPADADISGTSQDMEELKRKMARIEKILGTMSVG